MAVLGGLMAPVSCLASIAVTIATRGPLSLLNDFYLFWAAARVLNLGQDPYDNASLLAVLHTEGIHVLTGTGYSYPLLLAEVMRPLGLMPSAAAGWVFVAVSMACLATGTALLLGSIPRMPWWVAALGGIFAGLYPSVSFGTFEGQSNLLLLPSLALAYRGIWPGLNLAVAGAVKLFPAAGLLALLGTARRLREIAVGVATLAALLLLPPLLEGLLGHRVSAGGGRLVQLLGPDPYFTNSSINGLLSRAAYLPQWPRGLSVVVANLVVVGALTVGVLALLVRRHWQPYTGALAITLWLASIAAPKNSLWNFLPVLLTLTFILSRTRAHPLAATVAIVGYFLTGVQLLEWAFVGPLSFAAERDYTHPLTVIGLAISLVGVLMIGGAALVVYSRPNPPGSELDSVGTQT